MTEEPVEVPPAENALRPGRPMRAWRQAVLHQVLFDRHLSAVLDGTPDESLQDVIYNRGCPDAKPLSVEAVFSPKASRASASKKPTHVPSTNAPVKPEGADAHAVGGNLKDDTASADGSEHEDMDEEDKLHDAEGGVGDVEEEDDEEEESVDLLQGLEINDQQDDGSLSPEETAPKTQAASSAAVHVKAAVEMGEVWLVPLGAMAGEKRRKMFLKNLRAAGVKASCDFRPGKTGVAVMDPSLTVDDLVKVARKQVKGLEARMQAPLPAFRVDPTTPWKDVLERLQQESPLFDLSNAWGLKRERPKTSKQQPEGAAEAMGGKKIKRGYACINGVADEPNLNQHLTKWFEKLHAAARYAKDIHRQHSYANTIRILRRLPFGVYRLEDMELLADVRNIGPGTRLRIEHILEHGCLPMPQSPDEGERNILRILNILEDFTKIHGVGFTTAQKLYEAGYRSLEDLELRGRKDLTRQQNIGLTHWKDFEIKIPRAEVTLIQARVAAVVERLLPGASVTPCGSYRRGKSECGDVDILISPTRQQEHAPPETLTRIIQVLAEENFLTDHLSLPGERDRFAKKDSKRAFNEMNNIRVSKDTYMGVCRLSEQHRYRRIDMKVYPASQLPFALLYFTGSQYFNLSMRHYAITQHRMSLSDTGLRKGVWDDNGKLRHTLGDSVACEDEAAVFAALGLPYKAPNERELGVVERGVA